MISMIRIDDRLIHGQVAFVWTKFLGVNRIIVANDKIVNNEVQKISLQMATPDTAKCSILSVDDTIQVLNDPRAESLKILVITNNPTDVRRIVEKVSNVPLVNVANYGRIATNLSSKKKLCDTVYVTDQDIVEFEKIIASGIKTEYQVVPTNNAKPMYDLLKSYK
ncbi:MAG: putative system, sorbose-specific component [Firmicutes bacterium]|nr:putative system, sorbose-specific component [Bacillota bacterium]